MAPQGLRLRKNSDIERVFRRGKPIFYGILGCRYLIGSDAPLVAFSVSKKQFPTAVKRNRIRRWLRESFRAQYAAGAIPSGEYVFFLSKQAKKPLFGEICDSMRAIFEKIR